jgi:2-methylisocitrate lyase-like PEP mutase family enzyme
MHSSAQAIDRWWSTLATRNRLEVVCAYDSMTARLAMQAGFDAVLLGGGATANFMYGLPDIGLISLAEMLENGRRIAASVDIPVIADVDDAGTTDVHIIRTVQLAESSGLAGVMIEDVDSSIPKHLWNEERSDWDLSKSVLYPLETSVHRLEVACKARVNPKFVVIARTDALDSESDNGIALALERAQAYATAGADMIFIRGLQRDNLTKEFADAIGAPLLHGEVDAVDKLAKKEIFATGASLFHGLLPIMAAYSVYKETLIHLREGTLPPFDRKAWSVNRELLETVDLPGWSRHLRPDR